MFHYFTLDYIFFKRKMFNSQEAQLKTQLVSQDCFHNHFRIIIGFVYIIIHPTLGNNGHLPTHGERVPYVERVLPMTLLAVDQRG